MPTKGYLIIFNTITSFILYAFEINLGIIMIIVIKTVYIYYS
jgi:hypothetical protein